MTVSGDPRCGRCGAVLRAEDPLCPHCLFQAVSANDSRALEEQLFQQALVLESGARIAFVHEATRENPSLRDAVLQLLEGYEEAGGDAAQATHGDAPHARARWAAPRNEEPGTVIGHFRLIRLLGEGGMGSVWRAEQTAPVRRMVALKVIKLGMDTREVVRRFERERQTLASLSHPNIAQVYEAGATALGRPYFAMELVEGQPITAYCESAGLPLEARLKLVRDVCAAVEHAHQKGVIHRDLKPSNILVANGSVKVIDFGVAKATQGATDASVTQQIRIVGTPAYMSPEQARLGGAEVDTRSDVYALGVVLYELLTGTLPIDPRRLATADVAELQRILREENPPTPSTRLAASLQRGTAVRLDPPSVPDSASVRDRAALPRTSRAANGVAPREITRLISQLRGDLDRVVGKAIRKEPSERYASAAALSEDLRRYLAHEPVEAVPPSLGYHVGKFVRRHRVAVIATAAILLALAAGTLVSTVLAIQARRAASRERIARHETERTLARLYSLLANNHGREGHPEQAALWAAKAAEASLDDPAEHDVNLRRAALWTAGIPMAVRAFQSDFFEIRKLIFHPQERHLLAEVREGDRQIWDLDQERKLSFGGVDRFTAAAWNPEGSLLAVAPRGAHGITLHRFPEGTIVQSPLLQEHGTNAITSLAFNCQGTLLASGAGRNVTLFRRGDDGRFTFLTHIPQTNTVLRIVFSPTDPHCLATAVATNLAGLFVVDPEKPGYTTRFAAEPHILLSRRIDSAEPPRFDRSGTRLSLCRNDGRAGIRDDYGMSTYEVATGRPMGPVRRLKGLILDHGPDGRFVVCRHEGATPPEVAGVADVASGEEVSTVTFNRIVTVASFDTTGQRALVGSEDGQVLLLAAPDWQPERQLALHQARVMGVAFAPGGRLAATAQAGGLIRIWRVQDPHRSFVRLGHDSRAVLSHDGRFFALTGRSASDATLTTSRVYRTSDAEPTGPVLETGRSDSHRTEDETTDPVAPRKAGTLLDAVFDPSGDLLATANAALGLSRDGYATNAGTLALWNWRTGERLGDPIRTPSEPRSLAWSPDGREIAVCCAGGQFLTIDPATRRVDLLHPQNFKWPARSPVNNGEVAYAPAGTSLLSWGMPRVLQVWSLLDGTRHHRTVDFGSVLADVAIHPVGVLAAAQTGTRNGNPKVFFQNATTGEPIIEPLVQPEWMNSVAFDTSGKLLLTTARDGLARIWDWRNRTLHCPPIAHRGSVHAGRFVPATPYAATGADRGTFTLLDTRTGVEVSSFHAGPASSRILEIEITADGRRAVFGGKGLGGVGLVALDLLHGPPPPGLKGLLQLTSLNAAATVDRDNALTPMTAEEWLKRWNEFRRDFPDYQSFR